MHAYEFWGYTNNGGASYYHSVKKLALVILSLATALTLSGCGSSAEKKEADPAAYNKCLETEAAKWLDETGSNLDYANEKAAQACADLK